MSLIIDPGHGGKDKGGNIYGYYEKELNLIVAKRLQVILGKFNPDITRTEDVYLSSTKRSRMIKNKYEHCLSIHFNMNAGDRIEGIYSIYSKKGKIIAESITSTLKDNLGLPVRVFSRSYVYRDGTGDYYFMHRLTGSTVTVIVECLPLDTQYTKLQIENICQAVALGFIRSFEKKPIVEYKKIGSTNIMTCDPLDLRFAKTGKTTDNCINGMFYGRGLTVGTGYSEGEMITKRLKWDNVKRGTFIVHKNGTVNVDRTIDPDKDYDNIWFCVQGLGLNPIDLKAEWQPLNIGRKTNRILIGYNPKQKKIYLVYRPNTDLKRGRRTLINLGCVLDGKVLGIGLDSGLPCTFITNGNDVIKGKNLDNIIYVKGA